MNQPSLFTPPVARVNQRLGLHFSAPMRDGIRSIVAAYLHAAGERGATIQELAEYVGNKRGQTTKETSITQPLKDLREEGLVRDSGRSRTGNAGVANTVWVHVRGVK
jgi:chromosome segregation and condensation protein ScpB